MLSHSLARTINPLKEKKEAFGEALNGNRLVSAPYKLDFLRDKDSEFVWKKKFMKEEAVNQEGKEPSECKYCLFKHIHFDIGYKDRVIEINVRVDPNILANLTEDQAVEVKFLYTVKWNETNIPFEKRMDKYS
ncbi:hypothetical protein Pint_33721 [Pistacia integerrima]|uniref:Uncharacterized protein n=1 Tax=Pistacia integerrima TaxID=434235 RepID=A0ACC0X6I4_9ROSI|nr:hypothetical protein Pint_33721 [Pistacia integerrima]